MPMYRVTASGLNIRSGPGKEYSILRVLTLGTVVEDLTHPDWCPVLGGWVHRGYLAPYEDVILGNGQITGEMLLKQAEKHLTDPPQKYVLGARVDLNDPDWKGPWDCAEKETYDVKWVTGKIYGALNPGSAKPDPWTGAWYNDMKAGRVIQIPVEQAMRTPGALLLRYDKKVQHIVMVGHNRTTVEARGKAYGVVRHTVDGRGFQYGILIPGVEYFVF